MVFIVLYDDIDMKKWGLFQFDFYVCAYTYSTSSAHD